ncbi:MAG: PDZ domain-containing protein [Planctomycetaceae bacterium]|nr:PDZ domain-containing protein [Planctomycetaceae bacterium]
MNRFFLAGLLAGGLIGPAAPLLADEPGGLAAAVAIQDAFVKAIESAEKSVVSIARDKAQPQQPAPPMFRRNQNFQFPPQHERPTGLEDPNYIPNEFGAGIVIGENGLILTNYHLVRGGPEVGKPEKPTEQKLYVRLADRRGYAAQIYAADPRSNLAVLKIAATDLQPLRLGNASTLRKGQFAIALGNPYLIARDGSASASWGIISNLTRQAMQDLDLVLTEKDRMTTLPNLGVLIQVDTRLELGTSGGALINLQGDLIGITTSLASIVGYEKSAGFALPVDDSTRRIIEALKQGKEVEYGFLGITPEDVFPSEFQGELSGIAAKYRQYGAARILKVLGNLPADRAGIKANDLVLRVGEKPILSTNDLMREIGLLAPGTSVRLKVWRVTSGREFDFPVEIGKWPAIDEDGLISSVRLRDPWRGLVYDYPTARRRLFKQIDNSSERNSGVLILEVAAGSPSAAAELVSGDLITHVNRRRIRSPKEFLDAVQTESGPVSLQYLPGSSPQAGERTVEVKPR